MACHTQSSACNRKFLEIVRRGHIYIIADSVFIVLQCTTTYISEKFPMACHTQSSACNRNRIYYLYHFTYTINYECNAFLGTKLAHVHVQTMHGL